MSYKYLIDENLSWRHSAMLRACGHDATDVRSLNLTGASDRAVWEAARSDDRVIITTNAKDFVQLAQRDGKDPAIVQVMQAGPNGLLRTNDRQQALATALPHCEANKSLTPGSVTIVDGLGPYRDGNWPPNPLPNGPTNPKPRTADPSSGVAKSRVGQIAQSTDEKQRSAPDNERGA